MRRAAKEYVKGLPEALLRPACSLFDLALFEVARDEIISKKEVRETAQLHQKFDLTI
jgi:hypothetical protein